jgi:hypothetical protein
MTIKLENALGVPISPRDAIMLGAQSLEMYGKIFFPKTFRQESPAFHREIGEQLYANDRYNAFEVFRDGAKTSLLRVFTSQRIAYGISRTIMYVSSSQTHSIFSLRWLKRQVVYNTAWAQLFGLRKGEKWTDEILEIYHGVDETPITVLAMGITGQIRGFNLDDYRPDLIIADDVQTDENVATIEQRTKLKSTFHGALVNSLAPETDAPHAKVVLLNTPMEKDDLIESVMEDPLWNGKRFGIFDENGKSRWEARWPTETMKREKEAAIKAGRYSIWMREKECKVVKAEHKTFDTANLKFWDVLPEGIRVEGAIDPASSDSKNADDNVVGTVGFHGPDIYLLDYSAEKGEMPDATCVHFFELGLRWQPRQWAVESVSFQRVLAWYIEQEMKKKRLFWVVNKIQDRRRKNDRIIQALAGALANGHLWCKPHHVKFIAQLDDFNPLTDDNKDDVLDMVSMAVTAQNPYLMEDESVIEVEMRRIYDEEDEITDIEWRGAP